MKSRRFPTASQPTIFGKRDSRKLLSLHGELNPMPQKTVKGRDGVPIVPSPTAPSPASTPAQALPKLSPKPARRKPERIKKARSKRGGNGRRT
jgi:hypothetical protein